MSNMISRRLTKWATALALCIVLAAVPGGAIAQNEPSDQGTRVYRSLIRFVTESDYPPFNYLDEDGTLTGFNVDVARALCLELSAACDVQVRPWADLLPAMRRGDSMKGSPPVRITSQMRASPAM